MMRRSDNLYSEILDQGPSLATLHLILEKMREERRFSEVVRACNKGLSHHPDDIRLRWMLAECYLEMGFFSLAETEINLAARTLDGLVPLLKFQADIFERQGRVKEALAVARKYVAHCPADAEAVELLGRLVKAEEQYASESGYTSPDLTSSLPTPEEIVPEIATHTLAEIYESQGQIQAALQTYRELIAHNPEDRRARERLEKLSVGINPGDEAQLHSLEKLDRREKMIGVLEGWLCRLQEINRAR